MDSSNEATRRLTPEEADARAAALIARYRDERKSPRRERSSGLPPSVGLAFVYLCGVVGGAVWHAKPLTAILVGLPVLLIGHAFLKRRRTESK